MIEIAEQEHPCEHENNRLVFGIIDIQLYYITGFIV